MGSSEGEGGKSVGQRRASQLDATLGPSMRPLRNELVARIVAAHEPYALRASAVSTMVTISEQPGCSQQDLAKLLTLDKSTMVAIVDQLEARGFARRERSPDDRRRNGLFITPAGEKVMQELMDRVLLIESPIRRELGEDGFAQLVSLLNRAYAALLAEDDE